MPHRVASRLDLKAHSVANCENFHDKKRFEYAGQMSNLSPQNIIRVYRNS